MRCSRDTEVVIETMEHRTNDVDHLEQGGDRFCFVDAGVLLIGRGILPQRAFQVLSDADVIDN